MINTSCHEVDCAEATSLSIVSSVVFGHNLTGGGIDDKHANLTRFMENCEVVNEPFALFTQVCSKHVTPKIFLEDMLYAGERQSMALLHLGPRLANAETACSSSARRRLRQQWLHDTGENQNGYRQFHSGQHGVVDIAQRLNSP
ncbi:hypothetical protein [Candidatus Raskinella chloraquaticus]|uniref:Uncharacterized protein n=1 Tax=Candidatus Raskinella chloraquaticus TaxID=1951219 RepID=A0A1W9HPA9_9HYPH|nr:MAG: hypothetical protein A4S15_14195 [Proteobacteria bacterium SG_bin8]